MKRALRWMAFAAMCGGAQAAGTLSAQADEPRAYGWRVGDVLTRQIRVDVPEGLELDGNSLPQPGRIGASFELRAARWHGGSGAGSHTLTLEYQVFRAPTAVRTLEIPPLTLRFTGQPRAQDLRIDALPVTVAPLVPVEVSPRRGLGEWQPDAAPPLLDTRPAQQRLLAYAVLALAGLAYLAHVYLGLPWLARRGRPFQQAWRAMQGAADPTPRAAFQRFHEALNRSAGAVLFEQGLDDFLAAQPRYAALRGELQTFFADSRALFFAGDGDEAQLQQRLTALRELCRRCRDVERGAA